MAYLITDREKQLILEINDKFQIARNILSQIADFAANVRNETPLRLTISLLTGVRESTVDLILEDIAQRKQLKFSDWWANTRTEPEDLSDISYTTLLRNIVKDHYIKHLTAPNIKTVSLSLLNDKKIDVPHITLQLDLKQCGFFWKRLPKTNKYIMMEKTDLTFRRVQYLYRMNEYKKTNRTFLHLEFLLHQKFFETEELFHMILAVAPRIGVIECHVSRNLNFDDFISQLLVRVPNDVVFVIQSENRIDKNIEPNVITPHSRKADIKMSLDKYNIPYDPDAHRADLYDLHKKYKTPSVSSIHHTHEDRLQEVLAANGYEVVHRPPELELTKYFRFIRVQLENVLSKLQSATNMKIRNLFSKLMKGITIETWKLEDVAFANRETEMYEDEMKLEVVLDEFMEKVKRDGIIGDIELEEGVFDLERTNNIITDSKIIPKQLKEGNYKI